MKNRKGFTITELVIVIAVIAILAAVLIPTFSSVIKKANNSAILQEAKNLYTAYQAAVNYAAGETAETTAQIIVTKGDKTYYVKVEEGSVKDTVFEEQPSAAPGSVIISAAANENGVTYDPAPCSLSNATCTDTDSDGQCNVCMNSMPAAQQPG